MTSLEFWAPASGLYGGIGFVLGSAFLFKHDWSWAQLVVTGVCGYLLGSIWFTVNGWLMLLELSNPSC